MKKKIVDKIVAKQKELLVQDEIFDRILDDITKEQLLEDIDKPAEESRGTVLKIAEIGLKKDIQNHIEDYDSLYLEILNCELYDNARDAVACIFEVITGETDELLSIDFCDNGNGVKDLREYLKLGGSSKDRISDSIGLAGQGAKLVTPFCIVYGITETKLEDGTVKAQLWFFCHAKDLIVYLDLKPLGKVTGEHGTHVEIKILKEALDYLYPNIHDAIYTVFQERYRTHLLQNLKEVRINGEVVEAEPFPEPEAIHEWDDHEGFIMVMKDEDKVESGLIVNIKGKDVMVLGEKDFGLDLPYGLWNKVTGYVKADELKEIIKVNKEGINKKTGGSIWQTFRAKMKNQIIDFLKDNGYLENKILKGTDELTAMLNRDLQYLFKHDSEARRIFKELLNKKKPGVTPKTTGSGRSKNAQVQNRVGPGKIIGRVIFEKESKDKGLSMTTDVNEFFKSEDDGGPSALGKNEKCTIKVYKKIPGQTDLIRLIPDIDIVGPDFVVDNVPLDTNILLKAYTTYGVPKHTNEPLGRPKGFIRLDTKKKEEKAIIPIQVQENFSYEVDDRDEEIEFAFIERRTDSDGVVKDVIIVNSAHPWYKMHEKEDNAKYVHTLASIIYAVCSTIEDEDERKRTFKKFLQVILKRR